ncbi:hypothetical protein JCM10212_001910 [Sporobolomyces blumeae]
MSGSSESRSIESVTRKCCSQSVSSESWIQRVRATASDAVLDGQVIEHEVTAVLVQLLQEAPNPSPSLLGYIASSIRPYSTSATARSLVQSLPLARAILEHPTLSPATLDAVFSRLAAEQATSGSPLPVSSPPSESAKAIGDILDQTLSRFVDDLGAVRETIHWVQQTLNAIAPSLNERSVDRETRSDLRQKLESALKTLAEKPASEQSQALVEAMSNLLGRLSKRRRPCPPLTSQPHGPDIELFITEFVRLGSFILYATIFAHPILLVARVIGAHKQFSPEIRGKPPSPVSRFVGCLEYRRAQASLAGLALDEVATRTFSDLFEAAIRYIGVSGEVETMKASLLSVKQLLAALCRRGLVSPDAALSVDSRIPQDQLVSRPMPDYRAQLETHDADEIKHLLQTFVASTDGQAEFAEAVCVTLSSYAESSDLHALAVICTALLDNPAILQILFVHVPPCTLLSPIRATLDSFDTSQDNFGESNLIERFGSLVLFVQLVVYRFKLSDDLSYHLGSSHSFLASWIPTSSAAHALPALDEDSRAAVGGFIGALFGDGISDDLMHATNPRTLLRVAPTILKQSLVACQSGAVDLDSLKDALSYFLQELLSFTLPGVLAWLISEIERTPPCPEQAAMFDILQVILFADSLPRHVLELVALDLANLVSGSSSVVPPPFDVRRVKKLIVGSLPQYPPSLASSMVSGVRPTWAAQLQSSLTRLIDSSNLDSTRDAACVQQALSHLLAYGDSSKVARLLLSQLLGLAPLLPTPAPTAPSPAQETLYKMSLEVERAGSYIFATGGGPSLSLLYALVTVVLPGVYASSFANAASPNPVETSRTQMLADLVAGAFSIVLEAGPDTNDVQRQDVAILLDRLASQLTGLARPKRGRDAEDVARPTPLSLLFIERILSWPRLAGSSKVFAQILETVA